MLEAFTDSEDHPLACQETTPECPGGQFLLVMQRLNRIEM